MLYFQLQHLDHLIMDYCWHKVSNNMLIMSLYSNYRIVLLSEPDMWNLIRIVIPKIKASWKSLAYSMRYDVYEVSAFEKEGNNLNECCNNLFTNWLTTDRGSKPKTYQTLLKCIKEIDDLTAASEQIERAD